MTLDRPKKANLIKVRLMIAILATLCPVVCYISRQNISMAVVAMVDSTEVEIQTQIGNQTKTNDDFVTCPKPKVQDQNGLEVKPQQTYGPTYKWSQSEKSLVFESFFWTYVICQIPGARLAEVIGAKWILTTAALGSAILSAISPWAVSVHVYAFAVIRALMGICQTALYPACYVLYSQWLPPVERSQALPILGVGAYLGSIIASTATGYLIEQKSLGWPYAFYMPSVLCAIWSVLWILLSSSKPREHMFISLEEIEYIESKMEVKKVDSTEKKSPSWIKIATSRHIWTMAVAFFASNWSFSIVLMLLPSYLNYILHIPPFKNGLINSSIYILFCISSPIVGAVSVLMIETRTCGLSRLRIRKLFESVALFGQALCFLALPLIGCDKNFVLAILYTQIVLYSFINGGEVQLPPELSLDFAGTIYAIGNCVGSATGFVVPRVHSLIVKESENKAEWDQYFYMAALVTFIGGMIFLIAGKNDLQDFSKDKPSQEVEVYQMSTNNPEIINRKWKTNSEKQISI